MVRYRRNLLDGGTYFFTLTLADRRSRLLFDHVDLLREALRVVRKKHPFSIDAIVVLPDHFHVVMTLPADDCNYSDRWMLIKRRFTDCLLQLGVPIERQRNGELRLWQRRFWEHTIRNNRDFEQHVNYVHFNPVKHGLVLRVCDWPFSSFHQYVRRGVLPRDWGGDFKSADAGFGERGG